jgi:hypothetical protein
MPVKETHRGDYISEEDSSECIKAVESEYYVYTQTDISVEDEERNYTSEVIMNEGKENVNSEADDVPADTTEDQEGKCASEVIMNEGKKNFDSEDKDIPADNIEDQEEKYTSEAERNKMHVAVENEFYESVHGEVAKIVFREGNYMTGADVNNVQEPVETEFHEDIQDDSETFHRNEKEGVEIEFHENIKVEDEEYKEEIIELKFIGMKNRDLVTQVKLLIIYFQNTYKDVFPIK